MSGKSGSDSSSSLPDWAHHGSTGPQQCLCGALNHTLYITGWWYHRPVSCYYNTQRETTIIVISVLLIFSAEIGFTMTSGRSIYTISQWVYIALPIQACESFEWSLNSNLCSLLHIYQIIQFSGHLTGDVDDIIVVLQSDSPGLVHSVSSWTWRLPTVISSCYYNWCVILLSSSSTALSRCRLRFTYQAWLSFNLIASHPAITITDNTSVQNLRENCGANVIVGVQISEQ